MANNRLSYIKSLFGKHSKTTASLRSRGQSLVELAVVFLVVVLLVSGIVDLGRVFFYFQAMREATQEGAAYASAFPFYFYYATPQSQPEKKPNCTEIKNRIKVNLPPDIADANIKIYFRKYTESNSDPNNYFECADTAAVNNRICAPNEIKIDIEKPDFPVIMPLVSFFIGQTIPLKSTITSTVLQPLCTY